MRESADTSTMEEDSALIFRRDKEPLMVEFLIVIDQKLSQVYFLIRWQACAHAASVFLDPIAERFVARGCSPLCHKCYMIWGSVPQQFLDTCGLVTMGRAKEVDTHIPYYVSFQVHGSSRFDLKGNGRDWCVLKCQYIAFQETQPSFQDIADVVSMQGKEKKQISSRRAIQATFPKKCRL